MVSIAGLHVLALAAGWAMKGPQSDSPMAVSPIRVELISQPRRLEAQPQIKVNLEDPVLPAPVAPLVQITLPDEPPVAAITVSPPPRISTLVPVPGVGADSPVTVSEPDYLQMPQPVYPVAARRARAQGLVQVRALVDEEGHAREATVARSSGFELLDRAACEAVRRALFKPYRLNNVARSMIVIVPVEFSLKPGGVDSLRAAR